MYKILMLLVAILAVSGCHTFGQDACSGPVLVGGGSPADKKLNYGVLSYEEGNYQASITALQGVLDTGLSGRPERVMAYKYLAFIQCISGREALCKEYFRKALEIDPNFNLTSAEAGHPIWGPAFRSVKSKSSK